MYDVIIIGGGITGTCIARELSKYELHILLVEKNPEICAETSRINSGIIHGGYDAKEGTLKARLNVRGNKLVRELAPVLHLHFKQCGSLVTAFSQEEMQTVHTLYERGKTNGAEDLALWDKKTVLKAEPNLSAEAEGALYCGDLSYDVVKSTMSHHFRVLRESGLMHTEREGKHRRITRRDDVIEQRFPGLLAAVGLPAGKGQWPD